MSSEKGDILRKIQLKLPKGKSAFLWGARKTGKSTLLKERFKESLRFDFLRNFQILQDTLVRHSVEPYARTRGRDLILKAPKFYLFDVGVAGILMRRTLEAERGAEVDFILGEGEVAIEVKGTARLWAGKILRP